jgi:hypothetical protein
LADQPQLFKAKAEQTFSEILKVSLSKSEGAKFAMPDWAMEVIKDEFHVNT